MGLSLLCAKCEKSAMTWLVDKDAEIDTRDDIMECNDPECKAQFVGLAGWQQAWNDKRIPVYTERIEESKEALKTCGLFDFQRRGMLKKRIDYYEKEIEAMGEMVKSLSFRFSDEEEVK